MAGVLYGSWFGWDLLDESGRKGSLALAKKEAQEDPSFAKTAERAANGKKFYKRADNISFGAMLVTAGAALTLMLAPVAAAIAAPLFTVSLVAGLTALTAKHLAGGSYKAASAVANVGERIVARKRLAALVDEAKLKGPASVAGAPSPTASFDKAANSNEPPKPEAKDAAPAIKPEAPKL
jgi:hypothetical protein